MIERTIDPTFVSAIFGQSKITGSDVAFAIQQAPDAAFVANVPGASIIDGSAWECAKSNAVGLGRLGDLMRAIRHPDVRGYIHPETRFVERGLVQHSAVSHFRRLDDVRYEVQRHGMPSLVVAMVNDYEVTADVIRSTWERYGPFSILVATNPNSRETGSSMQVASGLNVGVLKWGPFLGRLSSP
jgi:hypothetical protein